MDTAKLKEILNGLMTINTHGNDSITMTQCMVQLDQYIKKADADVAKENEGKGKK